MSLPTDIRVVELIIEDFIAEHTKERTKLDSCNFIPQSYLIPLLRVCTIWHEVTERYLYRSIAVGSRIRPPPLSPRKNEHMHDFFMRKALADQPVYLKRDGHEFAEGLLATLTSSPRLAALVKTLRLGIELIDLINCKELPELTQTNIRILNLCPNVEHVEIRGFEFTRLDALVDVLKAKSLVSLCISPQTLNSDHPGFRGGVRNFSHVLDMMRKWPRLRSMKLEELWDAGRGEESEVLFNAVSERCPELQEIIFTGTPLFASELRTLRSMCSGVTKLSVQLYEGREGGRGDEATNALCECLRAWSSTLEFLKIESHNGDGALAKAISRLNALKELQVSGMKLELASISQFPRLERFGCPSAYSWTELERLLEDSSRLPSLTCIALYSIESHAFEERIRNLCVRWTIKLKEGFRGIPQEASGAGFLL